MLDAAVADEGLLTKAAVTCLTLLSLPEPLFVPRIHSSSPLAAVSGNEPFPPSCLPEVLLLFCFLPDADLFYLLPLLLPDAAEV